MSPLFILTFIYFTVVCVCAKRATLLMELHLYQGYRTTKGTFQKLRDLNAQLRSDRENLHAEAFEIFTLYEITREITKSFNEKEAFEIFKRNLKQHVTFRECHFLDSLSEEEKEAHQSKGHFVFTLQSKRMKIGYLAIEGAGEEEKEKIMILGHQFALALRRVRLYREIERIAITDSLTEVHTRRHTVERFREELKRSKARDMKMSFIMVDVDHFKKFNDKYGHITGDQILREVGELIRQNIREIDIAGRYGGEEFCVILPDTDREGAHFAAERIRRACEEALIKAYDTSVKMTVSIGSSTYPDDGKTMDELMDKADWALYRAKKEGRNTVRSFGVYDDDKNKDRNRNKNQP